MLNARNDPYGHLFDKNDAVVSLNNFATSPRAIDRENYARILEVLIHTEPYVLNRDYKEILNTLDIVANDSEVSVRCQLSTWLQRLCMGCLEREQSLSREFNQCVLEKVLSIIVRYLMDEPVVRGGAFETLDYLIEKNFLDKATAEMMMCPLLEKFCRQPLDTFDEEQYIDFIHLMVKIVPIVGYAKTYELVYDRFVEMCSYKEHFVRRECAMAFPVMCEVLGDEIFERSMLPIFMKLCDDEIWTVRRSCADAMPLIALLCTLEKRRKVLVPAMKKFMFDPSQWVIVAALKHLGQFLTTFAQLRVLGLAYNNFLELTVANAADRHAFDQLHTKRVTYGNQPSGDALLKNFECYEKRFRDSIQRYALLSLVKSNEEPWKARGDDMINVEVYLYSIVYADRRSQRHSTGSNSDDGGISKISDFSYNYYVSKSLSASSLCTPKPVQLHRGVRNYDEKNPLNRFLRYCSPMKNNFADAFSKQGGNGGGSSRESESDTYFSAWGPKDDPYNILAAKMKFLRKDFEDKDTGESEGLNLNIGIIDSVGDADITECSSSSLDPSSNQQQLPEEESKTKPEHSQNQFDEGQSPEEEALDQSYNSHQFWYISPELPLDLDFIDADTVCSKEGDASAKNSDMSNNNTCPASVANFLATAAAVAPYAATELESQEDNKNNNSDVSPTVQKLTAGPDNDTNNDSDSSYGSINNNSELEKPDNDLERYCVEPQKPLQAIAGGAVGSYHQQLDTVTAGVASLAIQKENERLKDIIKWQNEEVEWNLLEDFVHMKNINKELCFECAFNFPAIVLTFGEKFWPILSSHFFALCSDIQDNVRRTIAASITKIALIIGREQATRDLVAPYTEFLMDTDEIKLEVVNTLAEFLKVVDGSEHETLMDQLGLCLQPPLNMMNWRFREAVARQVIQLVKMHTKIRKENCLLYLTGLAMRLMIDKYDFVRKAGLDAFVECAREFQRNDAVFKFFSENFAQSSNWRRRQTYIIAAGKMLESEAVDVDMFRKHMLRNILNSVGDPVPNIRTQVAKCLKEIIMPHPRFTAPCPDTDAIEQTVVKLRGDVDRDVRGHIDGYLSPEEEAAGVAGTEVGASGSTIDTASTSSTSSTSSLSPPPSAHPIISSASNPDADFNQQQQLLQPPPPPPSSEFPTLSNDTWYFDNTQHQECEF